MKEENNEQFTLSTVLVKLMGFIPFVKKNKKFIIIATVSGFLVGLGVEIYRNTNSLKKTKIVFNLETENGSSGLGDIAATLGLGGLNSGSSMFSGENFKELLRTKNIYRKAILTKVKVGNKVDFFGMYF